MKSKLYTVGTNDTITGLGIEGPLTTPTKMEFINVLHMVKRGYIVYEHNPADLAEKVRVTINNINSIKFQNSRAAAVNRQNLNIEMQEMDNAMNVAVISKNEHKKEAPEPLKAPEKPEVKNKTQEKSNEKPKSIGGNDFSK